MFFFFHKLELDFEKDRDLIRLSTLNKNIVKPEIKFDIIEVLDCIIN